MYDELVATMRRQCVEMSCGNCGTCVNRQAADAIEELQADKGKPRWIPVSERLPEENAPCIVYNKYYGPMVGWRLDGKRFRIPGSHFPDHPTHWMPLPQPPKEE